MLRRAQCDGSHLHGQLIGGKAKACEVYPDPFVELICEGILKELEDVKWRDRVAEKFDIGDAIEKIMSITEAFDTIESEISNLLMPVRPLNYVHSLAQLGPTTEDLTPPHEADGTTLIGKLYQDCEFFDDVTGGQLDKALTVQARKEEVNYFKKRGVYTKNRREPWMQVISTIWLDINKGDTEKANI